MPSEWVGAALVERTAAPMVEPSARVVGWWDALRHRYLPMRPAGLALAEEGAVTFPQLATPLLVAAEALSTVAGPGAGGAGVG